jgi:hypothetical protein
VAAGTDRADALDERRRHAVHADAAGNQGVEGHEVADDERAPSVRPATTLRTCLVLSTAPPGPPIQNPVTSNSNATGTTSGCPSAPTVASLASGWLAR